MLRLFKMSLSIFIDILLMQESIKNNPVFLTCVLNQKAHSLLMICLRNCIFFPISCNFFPVFHLVLATNQRQSPFLAGFLRRQQARSKWHGAIDSFVLMMPPQKHHVRRLWEACGQPAMQVFSNKVPRSHDEIWCLFVSKRTQKTMLAQWRIWAHS